MAGLKHGRESKTPGFDQIYGQKGGVTFLMKFVMPAPPKSAIGSQGLSSQPHYSLLLQNLLPSLFNSKFRETRILPLKEKQR